MTHKRRENTTKKEIIQSATRMFLEKGYTSTSIKAICDELGISTGNLTFYFPTKEHLLAVLVGMLCDYQWKMLDWAVDQGNSSLLAMCLELPAMVAICDENEIAKDFYLSAYTHPMSLEIIRRNDMAKAKRIFAAYCPNWTEEQYMAAETIVSGMEYATLMKTPSCASLHTRIQWAVQGILTLYCVPEKTRQMQVEKVLAMDYRAIGRQILTGFMEYIEMVNEQALGEAIAHD